MTLVKVARAPRLYEDINTDTRQCAGWALLSGSGFVRTWQTGMLPPGNVEGRTDGF